MPWGRLYTCALTIGIKAEGILINVPIIKNLAKGPDVHYRTWTVMPRWNHNRVESLSLPKINRSCLPPGHAQGLPSSGGRTAYTVTSCHQDWVDSSLQAVLSFIRGIISHPSSYVTSHRITPKQVLPSAMGTKHPGKPREGFKDLLWFLPSSLRTVVNSVLVNLNWRFLNETLRALMLFSRRERRWTGKKGSSPIYLQSVSSVYP